MALLVALVSVTSLSIPIVSKALDDKDSHIHILYQGARSDKAYFLVTNSGSRDGTINYVKLVVSSTVRGLGAENRVAVRFDVPPITVAGGKSEQITVSLAGDARKLIDHTVYEMWKNNVSKTPVDQAKLQFRIGYSSFKDGKLDESVFTPELNDLLLAGPTDWYKCAGSIAWGDWNGPGSHFYPQDIDPTAAEAFCGKLPSTFNDKARDTERSPWPDADAP